MSKHSSHASAPFDLFDEKAAARIAEVHPRTLRRWRERGLIACYQTPTGRIRYKLEDLMIAVSEQRMPSNVRICPQTPSSAP